MSTEQREWLKTATLEEVEGFIEQTSPGHNIHAAAIAERDQRYHRSLKKPHWTLVPGFWVAVLAMIFAAIAALPVFLKWFGAN